MLKQISIITGGIGSGKSFVLNFLSRLGYSTFSSDLIVKKLLSDKNFLLEAGLGEGPFQERILQEAKLLDKLEEAFYPVIKKEREAWLQKEVPKGQLIFIEIPLFFEKYSNTKPLDSAFSVISTVAGIKLQKARVLKRGIKSELLDFLVSRQVSDEIRLAKSDYIIYTSESKKQVKKAIKKILNVTTNRNSF
jgi:dephospho-CoA kinase